MVYKVIATEFLPLRERPLHDPDEDTYLALLNTLLVAGPMYFSYSLDITNSFQRQAQADFSRPIWMRADDRFFWNKFIQSDLIDFRNGMTMRQKQQSGVDPYILPVMFGMLRITPTRVKSTSFTFALITRRSRHRGGTRYFSRGIDEQGHVSNYNETEQLMILNDNPGVSTGFGQDEKLGRSDGSELQIMSYVQTRGSVPVFWAEVNNLHYVPKLEIRGVSTAIEASRRHFDEQIRLYGENYLVNLVNQKGREARVKEAYEQAVRTLMSAPAEDQQSSPSTSEKFHVVEPVEKHQRMDRLHYIYFDFHNETKGLKWHRAKLLLDQLIDGLNRGQYFRGVEMPGDSTGQMEIRNLQSATVRTNCMDCLDRTNVVQSMLGRWAINKQLQDIGILQPHESANDDAAFENLFRNVWADNADVVSRSYSGTGALKTDFTRTGERTKMGMLQDLNNSLTRYARNNFLDGPRQDAFDLFLGAYLPPSASAGSLVFTDRRPILIQAMPYVLAFSIFMVFIGTLTSPLPGSRIWPIRLFVLFFFVLAGTSLNFIYKHGTLYVSLYPIQVLSSEMLPCLHHRNCPLHIDLYFFRFPAPVDLF